MDGQDANEDTAKTRAESTIFMYFDERNRVLGIDSSHISFIAMP